MSKKGLKLTIGSGDSIWVDPDEVAAAYPVHEYEGTVILLKGRDTKLVVQESVDYVCDWVFGVEPINIEDIHFKKEVEELIQSNRQMARTMDLISSIEELRKKIQEL